MVITVLSSLISCSTSTSVCKIADGDQEERLKWYIVVETSQGKTEQQIKNNLIKVSEDMYCDVGKEQKIPNNKLYGGMRSKLAKCTYLKEHFQLWTVCDKQMGVVNKVTTKVERELDINVSIRCEME